MLLMVWVGKTDSARNTKEKENKRLKWVEIFNVDKGAEQFRRLGIMSCMLKVAVVNIWVGKNDSARNS